VAKMLQATMIDTPRRSDLRGNCLDFILETGGKLSLVEDKWQEQPLQAETEGKYADDG
jgi:hypothetical protein